MKELVSYAIGCMMGRYSSGRTGSDLRPQRERGLRPQSLHHFPADDDGIIPITDTDWFDDDACHRLIEFISVAWDAEHLEENLTFLADNLSPKKNESSRETIRRYLCDKFFKDHLQTYKKRPIYWLFSSGKQLRAFQCLVYLHRYNEGTLARMRTEYVIPLQGKMAARIEQRSGDINAATSTAHSKKLEREKDKLAKQQAELQAFDEKLRHYADQRISLDLDDGVKVNYGKFGDLLADVKAVSGKSPK
jgi:type II restriction/modification system DNA methylase subunit YeeA